MGNDSASENQSDTSRRNLLAALTGFSAATLAACIPEAGANEPSTQQSTQAISGTSFIWFDRIKGVAPTLANTQGTAGQTAVVQCYDTFGDGGGGVFYWDSDTTTADDLGTVFVPAQSPRTGCWKRLAAIGDQRFNVRWFGAKGDFSTDDTGAVLAACAVANATSRPNPDARYTGVSRIYFPTGAYMLTESIYVPWYCHFEGTNQAASALVFNVPATGTTQGDGLILGAEGDFEGSIQIHVHDLSIYNINPSATSSGGIDILGGVDCTVERCTIAGWAFGIVLDAAEQCVVRRCIIGGLDNVGFFVGVPASGTTGIWFASGVRHGRGNSTPGSANQNAVYNCQFNGCAVNVWHDDGVVHLIEGCNSEGGVLARITGGQRITHRGWTQEGADGALFHFDALSASESAFICEGFAVENCFFGGSFTNPIVLIDYYAIVKNVVWTNNFVLNTPSAGVWQVGSGPTGQPPRTCAFNLGQEPVITGGARTNGKMFDIAPSGWCDLNHATWDAPYTVSTLPSTSTVFWNVSNRGWVSDGCKQGQAAGAGSGAPAYYDGNSVWRYYSDDSPVNADGHGVYTVANLPPSGLALGATVWASNGRKIGEGPGAGTGVLVYINGSGDWRRVSDDSGVVA